MSHRVEIRDVRAAGLCLSGTRRHCAAVGLDFRRLVKEGLPMEEVAHLDDALVQRVVSAAREREENGNG